MEHIYYFIFFTIVSFLYIVNGYASLATNDDWALRGMLVAEGIYGTLIMSYPLSYVMSHLYDVFPSFQWYSILLTLFMGLNFYFVSLYIQKCDSYIHKTILLVLALLWMTFLWFNMSITILTITTMITAVGLIRKNLFLSFAFIFLASLLRIDMMFILMPYYVVSFFILREKLSIDKKEILALIVLIALVVASIVIQKQDRFYNDWLSFNKARSAIVDMGILKGGKENLSLEEKFCIERSWWQDETLFPSEKLIKTTPSLRDILEVNIRKIHFTHFIENYKFKHWLWLLLFGSVIVILFNLKNRRMLFVPLLVTGVILLLITRDVERVTVPLILLWAYVLFESLKQHRILSSIFIGLFTYIFYYYASGQLTYRYFKENTQLQHEAHQLISKNNKVCAVSINFPTTYSNELNTVFSANYLFYEYNWMQMNDKEILPGGWLVRHEYFYRAHDISFNGVERKYETYRDFLINDKTAFFGSKRLVKGGDFFTVMLKKYDKKYLADRPNCKHRTFIIDTSKHFSISQVRIDCNLTNKQ